MVLDLEGRPVIAYIDETNSDLRVARYVESGGNCTSSAWDCEKVEDIISPATERMGMVIEDNGTVWVSYVEEGSEDDIWVAKYVGSGGTGCSPI